MFALVADGGSAGGRDPLPFLIFVAAGLTAAAMVLMAFVVTVSGCLRQVRPPNRELEPRAVWLLLIPFYNWVHIFFVVRGVAHSVEAEYHGREWQTRGDDFGSQLGLVMGVCWCLSVIPVVAVAALVITVMYAVRVAGYRKRLESNRTYAPSGRAAGPGPPAHSLDADNPFSNLG